MSISRNVMWGELKGMRKIETVEQMPAEYRQTLLKILYALASTEFASVEQHQPWINQGPTAEDRYVQAQISADEAHQGFIDSRLLRTFGPEGEALAEKLLRLRIGEHPLHAFNVPFESWPDVCGFCFLMDHVAWYHLRAFEDSSFAPLARDDRHGARGALPRLVRRAPHPRPRAGRALPGARQGGARRGAAGGGQVVPARARHLRRGAWCIDF